MQNVAKQISYQEICEVYFVFTRNVVCIYFVGTTLHHLSLCARDTLMMSTYATCKFYRIFATSAKDSSFFLRSVLLSTRVRTELGPRVYHWHNLPHQIRHLYQVSNRGRVQSRPNAGSARIRDPRTSFSVIPSCWTVRSRLWDREYSEQPSRL